MKKTNRLIYLSIFLAIAFLLLGGNQAWATTVTALQNGNWSDANTWGGTLPTSVDNVDISSNTVLVDGDYTVNSIKIGSGYLKPATTGTYSLTLLGANGSNHAIEIATGYLLGSNSNGRLNIIITNTTSTDFSLGGSYAAVFNDLTISDGSAISNITDDWELAGNLTVGNNATLTCTSAKICNVSGTNSTITKATLGTLTFYTLNIAATATNVTTASDFTVSHIISLANGGKFNASAGTITNTHTGGNSVVSPANGSSTASDLSFYNITFNPAVTADNFTPVTSFRVKGNFAVTGSGKFTPTAGTVEFANSASKNSPKTISIAANNVLTFFDMKVTDGSNVKSSATFTIAGTAGSSDLTIEGTGSFVSTGSATFTGAAATMDVSNSAFLQMNNLIFANGSSVTSTSSLVLTGNFTTEGTGSAVFSTPSVVAFKDSTNNTAIKYIKSSSTGTLELNSIYLYDDANQTQVYSGGTAGNIPITVYGDIKVYGNSTLDFSQGSSTITMAGTSTKNFYNEGTLKFYNLSIPDGIGNVLTESNFEITNDLNAAGNDAVDGAIIASGNSIITFSKAGDPIAGTSAAANSFQSIKATAAITDETAANKIILKGDLIVGTGGSIDFSTNSGTVSFQGTSQQKIHGDVTLDGVLVNNSTGVLLEGNLTSGANSTAGALEITNGFIDLNGSHTITLAAATDVIKETGGLVKNTKPGIGCITTLPAGTGFANINGSRIGIENLTGGTGLVAYRYYGVKMINGLQSMTRYYYVYNPNSDLAGNATRFTLDETELNGNTKAQMTGYFSGIADANTYSSSASNTATNWYHTNGAVTATSSTFYMTEDLTPLTNRQGYYMFAPVFLTISYLPTTGINNLNKVVTSPLAANSPNRIIMGFGLTATKTLSGSNLFTALNVNMSRSPSGILSHFLLYNDPSLTNPSDTSSGYSGSLSGNTVQFSSLGQTFTAGTPNYYLLTADVDATVNSSTPTIFASMSQDGITMNNIYKKTQTINGTTYSFASLNTTLSTANAPSAGPLDIGTSAQTVFGFKLKAPAGSSVTFKSVNVKITFANGALYNDFQNWKLYVDANRNGIYNSGDHIVGTSITTIDQTTGILSYTGDVTLPAGEDENFILITDVKTTAVANGTLKGSIASNADVTLASPATVPSGGPYEGNSMTVRSSSGTPTKLSITAFSMKTIDAANTYDLRAKGENEVVVGEQLVLQVKAVDANGRPQKVDQATTVTLTPLGGGTVTNNTLTIPINQTTCSPLLENLTFSTASTANEFSLIATTTAGTSLTADTLTGIRVYTAEPASYFDNVISASSILATTATLSWTNAASAYGLLVVKADGWPASPEDGVTYNSSSNVSSPASSNGTTGTGSVVTYKGTGSTVALTGLAPNTTYYAKLFKYAGSGIGTNYLTWDITSTGTSNTFGDQVQFTTSSSEPTVASSGLSFSSVASSSMKVTWTKPTSGGGTYSLVVVGTADPTTVPTDTNSYTANVAFGSGSALGSGSSVGYVAYNGTGNAVTLTGLAANTDYFVRVYEFNGSAGKQNYLSTPYLSGDRNTLAIQPTLQANNISFSDMVLGTNTSITVNWERGNGDKVVLVGKAGSPIGSNETPSDESATFSSPNAIFGTGTSIGQGYVLYQGTGNTVNVTGLQYGQTYYFKAFEYNTGSGNNTTTDNSTINYNANDTTNNPNSRLADSYEPNDQLAEAKFITSDGAFYSGLISSATDADWFSFRPDFEDAYDNVRIKLTGLPANYTLELYRADGRLLRRSQISGTTDEVLVLNNLPVADYYVKIYSADGAYSLTPYRINVLNRTTDYKADTQ